MPTITIPVTPVAYVRQSQKDKWRVRSATAKYRLYRDEVRLHWRDTGLAFPDYNASLAFHLPMPDSWSNKKKEAMVGAFHHQTPDKDNLEKAFLDALFYPNAKSKIKLPMHNHRDDASIAHTASVGKYWAWPDAAGIEVILPDEEDPCSRLKQQLRHAAAEIHAHLGQDHVLVGNDFQAQMDKAVLFLENIERYYEKS